MDHTTHPASKNTVDPAPRAEAAMTRSVREDTTTALMRIRAAHPGWDVAWDDARRAWLASLRISPTATHDIYAHSLPVLEAKLDALASAQLSSAETVRLAAGVGQTSDLG